MASYTIQPSNGCPESGRWLVDRLWINGTDYSDMLAFFGVCLYKLNGLVVLDDPATWEHVFAQQSFMDLFKHQHSVVDIMIDLKGQPMRVFECELVDAKYVASGTPIVTEPGCAEMMCSGIVAQLFFGIIRELSLLNQDIEYFHKQGRQNA